jgi:flagellar hook-associated protein FlgK
MTKTIKRLNDLNKNIIKVIHELNDMPTRDLNILNRRFQLLKELANVLPALAELIIQTQLEDNTDIKIGMSE